MYNNNMIPAFMIKDRNNVCYVFRNMDNARRKLCEMASYLYSIINSPLTPAELQDIFYNEYFFFSDSKIEIVKCWLGD